jgi:hypothetical protein
VRIPGRPRVRRTTGGTPQTHLAYVKERRSEADGDALLEEALARLRARRGE